MSGTALSLIGASTRAAADSAWRAGWSTRACDLFGDIDLRLRADYAQLPGVYPRALADFVRDGPDLPWLYTGGLENHPELVDRIARYRPLWGNAGDTLRAVRDPFVLGRALHAGGFDVPESSRRGHGGDDRYLLKPLRGSGGGQIRFASERSRSTPAPSGHFYQRYRPGVSCSATFVGTAGSACLLGVTRQLVGEPWLHASRFAWCGNLGPIHLRLDQVATLERLGGHLASSFGLAGLYGVDFVLSEDRIEIIEVNPRYPASLEVLELATGRAALPLHRAAFDGAREATWPQWETTCETVIGKGVLRAPRPIVVTEDLRNCVPVSPFDVPRAADLPPRGTEVEAGGPILTVYARGRTEEECRNELREAARRFERRLLAPH